VQLPRHAEREVRSMAYQIKAARFPAYKDLAGFDFTSSEINEAIVRQLHRGEFIDGADNAVLIGGPGTGKTHVATALGIQAVEHHRKKVRFFATVDLVNALEQEKGANRAGQLADRSLRLDLLIFDELGYLPFSPSGGHCCSICSANFTSRPASSSRQTSASANGQRVRRDQGSRNRAFPIHYMLLPNQQLELVDLRFGHVTETLIERISRFELAGINQQGARTREPSASWVIIAEQLKIANLKPGAIAAVIAKIAFKARNPFKD
jgi:hypothetical protein